MRHDSRPEANSEPFVLDTELQEVGGEREEREERALLHPYWLLAQVSWANKKGRLFGESAIFSVFGWLIISPLRSLRRSLRRLSGLRQG